MTLDTRLAPAALLLHGVDGVIISFLVVAGILACMIAAGIVRLLWKRTNGSPRALCVTYLLSWLAVGALFAAGMKGVAGLIGFYLFLPWGLLCLPLQYTPSAEAMVSLAMLNATCIYYGAKAIRRP